MQYLLEEACARALAHHDALLEIDQHDKAGRSDRLAEAALRQLRGGS